VSALTPHLLHVFSTFVPAGPEMRTVRLIEACGREYRHSIVAIDGRTDARSELPRGVQVDVLESPPRAGSLATVRALRALIRRLRPDLVLSYNWGAFDAVFASASLLRRAHVHHEDGFTSEEVDGFKGRRVLARRLLLPRVHRVVVPSKRLYAIARSTWKLAEDKALYIPNGIRLERFAPADGRPELREQLGIPRAAPVIGSVGHLRPEKNPLRLLKACARVDPELGCTCWCSATAASGVRSRRWSRRPRPCTAACTSPGTRPIPCLTTARWTCSRSRRTPSRCRSRCSRRWPARCRSSPPTSATCSPSS
jgi:glycosyltransferase involved in cell wall biosynthesis